MAKIVHAADFHLDSPFAGLSPEKARQRRQESRELLDRLAALVKAERAELVLLSGDIFDRERVYPETLQRLRAALSEMACPVFIAPGNHDPYTPSSPYAAMDWPENVHIFSSSRLTAVKVPQANCVVHGAAFLAPEQREELLEGYCAGGDGLCHILCLHGDVTGGQSVYGPIRREQIEKSGFTYLALGHVHQFSGLQRQDAVCWAYPGCPEGRGFDELGEKGVLVGTVDEAGCDLRFVPLCRRRCEILSVDVTGRAPEEAIEELLESVSTEDVCRVILTGETEEWSVDTAALEARFAQRVFALQLVDRTTVGGDPWAQIEEDGLRGLFLRRLRERYDAAASDDEREKILLAVRFGLAALDGRDVI